MTEQAALRVHWPCTTQAGLSHLPVWRAWAIPVTRSYRGRDHDGQIIAQIAAAAKTPNLGTSMYSSQATCESVGLGV